MKGERFPSAFLLLRKHRGMWDYILYIQSFVPDSPASPSSCLKPGRKTYFFLNKCTIQSAAQRRSSHERLCVPHHGYLCVPRHGYLCVASHGHLCVAHHGYLSLDVQPNKWIIQVGGQSRPGPQIPFTKKGHFDLINSRLLTPSWFLEQWACISTDFKMATKCICYNPVSCPRIFSKHTWYCMVWQVDCWLFSRRQWHHGKKRRLKNTIGW